MSAEYFLGVDGGQSGTTALIADGDGRVLGMGRAGPSNHAAGAEGRARLTAAIGDSVTEACVRAGMEARRVEFTAACFGLSGGAEDKEGILRELVSSRHYLFTTDAAVALAGAAAGGPGIVVIAGTGSIALGRNDAGTLARAGGWGYLFGDEGGGFDIARRALRAALRMEEGWGGATSLRGLLLAETGAPDVNALLHRMYTPEFPRPRIALLAMLVDQAARAGDIVAARILAAAAARLARLAAAVRQRIFAPGDMARVSPVGGAFRFAGLLNRFRAEVEREADNRFALPVYGPAAGALLESYRAAGRSAALSGVPGEKE